MNSPTRMERRTERRKKDKKDTLLWVLELAAVLVFALLLRTFVFSLTTVQGPSMQETLHSGQVVAVDKLYYRLHAFSRGQVVICRYPNSGDYFVKRVVALPGETLQITAGVTLIDGVALDEPFVTHPATEDFGPVTVPEDCVFVMGDNRANSHDSRAEGALAQTEIVGRVFAVLYPFDAMRSIPAQTP